MNDLLSREAGSRSAGKRAITIAVIVLVCVGFAFFLFKISPQVVSYTLDTTGVKQLSEPAPFNPETDRYFGDPKAKNVLIEYGDLQCPACKQFEATVKQVPSVFGDTVVVFRYYPLVQIHKNAVLSALAAEAAGAQGKYWEMHDKLYAFQQDWENTNNPTETFLGYALSVGVTDANKFKKDLADQANKAKIESDNREALGLGLEGTPSFYFNGKPLKAMNDVNALKQQADPLRNK